MKQTIKCSLVLALLSVGLALQPKAVSAIDVEVSPAIPVYGNWCGPGHGGREGYYANTPATSVLDQGCKRHDICYIQNGYFNKECDRELVNYIDTNISYMKNGKEWSIAKAIRTLFFLSEYRR